MITLYRISPTRNLLAIKHALGKSGRSEAGHGHLKRFVERALPIVALTSRKK
jgi:hypothetical protein